MLYLEIEKEQDDTIGDKFYKSILLYAIKYMKTDHMSLSKGRYSFVIKKYGDNYSLFKHEVIDNEDKYTLLSECSFKIIDNGGI